MDRRDFLKKAAATTVLTSLATKLSHGAAESFPYRTLGHTGEKVSLIGLGGYHLGKHPDEQESIRIIRTALDNVVNFLHNCRDYNGGVNARPLLKALPHHPRTKSFLLYQI